MSERRHAYHVDIERDATGPVRLYYGSSSTGRTITMSPQERLRLRYAVARQTWRHNPNVQKAAATLGMTEREYCDRYVEQFGPILGTCTTDTMPSPLDAERAFREARP